MRSDTHRTMITFLQECKRERRDVGIIYVGGGRVRGKIEEVEPGIIRIKSGLSTTLIDPHRVASVEARIRSGRSRRMAEHDDEDDDLEDEDDDE